MVNTQLLDEKIHSSGLRQDFIVDKLGISTQAFIKKKQNKIKFRCAEVYVICDLLKITDDTEKDCIFFTEEV